MIKWIRFSDKKPSEGQLIVTVYKMFDNDYVYEVYVYEDLDDDEIDDLELRTFEDSKTLWLAIPNNPDIEELRNG